MQSVRIEPFKNDPLFLSFPPEIRALLGEKAEKYYLSFQDLKKLMEMAADLNSWEGEDLTQIWRDPPENLKGKERKHWSLSRVEARWQELKQKGPDYSADLKPGAGIRKTERTNAVRITETPAGKELILLGNCPVASEKTRCCNLLTLDAVLSCGYDCSYH